MILASRPSSGCHGDRQARSLERMPYNVHFLPSAITMSHTRPIQSTTQRHTIDLQVWVHRSALDTRWAKSFRGMKVTSTGDTSDGSFFSGLLQSINDDLARLAKSG